MRRFYADPEQFTDDNVELSIDETRHLRDVLRLHVGDEVSVFDGEGREYAAAVQTVSKKAAILKVTGLSTPPSPESDLDLHLFAALLKGDKYDLVVQKAVELGVNRFTPLLSRRCEVKMPQLVSRLERWRRIGLEACKQSGRARLMGIDDPVEFGDVIEHFQADEYTTVLFSEREGEKFQTLSANTKMAALVGPEGGWDEIELKTAKAAGVSVVTLGGRILRAETAAIAVTAILQHRFGDVN